MSKATNISDCPESFARWYCLNGASCFSVNIHESVVYACWCPVGFHGLRCDHKYVEGSTLSTGNNDIDDEKNNPISDDEQENSRNTRVGAAVGRVRFDSHLKDVDGKSAAYKHVSGN